MVGEMVIPDALRKLAREYLDRDPQDPNNDALFAKIHEECRSLGISTREVFEQVIKNPQGYTARPTPPPMMAVRLPLPDKMGTLGPLDVITYERGDTQTILQVRALSGETFSLRADNDTFDRSVLPAILKST